MRVLSICYEDPEDILGGMGMHVREIYRSLAKVGVHVDLITSGTQEGSKDYLGYRKHHDDKLICWKPKTPDISCRFMIDIQVAKTLTKLIAETYGKGDRWDVIHIHEWSSVQLGRIAQNALNLPLVGTMHLCLTYLAFLENPETSPADWGDADLYMMQQEGNLLCDPNEIILCSNAYVDIVREQFMLERSVNMIYNGIDTDIWNPEAGDGEAAIYEHNLEFSQGIPLRRPIALFCGRIAEMKGITYLLDALEAVDTGWLVVLAGEVNANTEADKDTWCVTQRIRKLEESHPERIRWVGFQRERKLRDLYAAADAVLMPSTHEPFGIVALEAMAMGAPLIATDVDGLGEIVIDSSGNEYAMIIPPRNPSAIAMALRDLKRKAIRTELQALGHKRAHDFSWDVAASKTLDVYQTAIRRYNVSHSK